VKGQRVGEYHLSFRVIAAGYRPSPSYTATLSNIPVATTTTTTIPGQTCLPGACDDHDACTVDSCVGGACQNEPATGIDAYVWMKPPGESDGSSTAIPNDEGKGFDRMCSVFNLWSRRSTRSRRAERCASSRRRPSAS
jgi:hypothetical protein